MSRGWRAAVGTTTTRKSSRATKLLLPLLNFAVSDAEEEMATTTTMTV